MDFEDEDIRRSSLMAFDAAEDSEFERYTLSRLEPCDAVSEAETSAYNSMEDITGNQSPIVYQSPVGSPPNRDALLSPVDSVYSNKPEIKKSPQPRHWVFATTTTQRQSSSKSPISPQLPRDESVSERSLVKSNSTPTLMIATPRIKKSSQLNIPNNSEQIIVNLDTRNNNDTENSVDPDKPFLIITEGDKTYDQTIRLLYTGSEIKANRNILSDFLRQNNFILVSDCEFICALGQRLRDIYFLIQKNTKKLIVGRLGYDGKELQLWPLVSQLKVLEEF